MHSRVLLLGDPNARPDGLERALIRAGFSLAEAEQLPPAPGDSGSPDLTILSIAEAQGDWDTLLMPITHEAWRSVPTIVLLPQGQAAAAARALSLGARDAMVAPIHLPELSARVVARLRGTRDGFRATSSSNSQAQLFAVFKNIALAARPEEMIQILVRGVAESLGVGHCACLLPLDPERGRAVAVAEQPDVRATEVPLSEYPEVRHAAAVGRTAYIPSVTDHPLFERLVGSGRDSLAGFLPSSAVAVPMGFQGRNVGFLVLRTRITDAVLSVDDVAFTETLVAATTRLLEHEERRATLYRRQASAGVIDPLTGCGGLDALERRLREEMQRSERYARRFTVAIVDVKGLRFLNQRSGVEAGDRVLTELGGLFQRELRSPDFVARYGGDVFALILPETDERGGRETLTRLRRAIARHTFPDLGTAPLEVEAGFASYPMEGAFQPNDLLAAAEASLTAAVGSRPSGAEDAA